MNRHFSNLIVFAVFLAVFGCKQNSQNQPQLGKSEIKEVIAAMTPEEKLA